MLIVAGIILVFFPHCSLSVLKTFFKHEMWQSKEDVEVELKPQCVYFWRSENTINSKFSLNVCLNINCGGNERRTYIHY